MAGSPDPQRRREQPGVHITRMPTPPTSTTAESTEDGGDRCRSRTRSSGTLPCGTSQGRIESVPGLPTAPDVTHRQRERVGCIGRDRSLGRACSNPRHHRGHLRLVGASAAGDGSLDLARRVQRDRESAPGRRDDGDARTPGPCPSRCGRCAGRRPARPRPRRAGARRATRRAPARWPAVGEPGRRRTAYAPRRRRPLCSGRAERPLDDAEPAPGQPGSTPSTRTDRSPSIGERTNRCSTQPKRDAAADDADSPASEPTPPCDQSASCELRRARRRGCRSCRRRSARRRSPRAPRSAGRPCCAPDLSTRTVMLGTNDASADS